MILKNLLRNLSYLCKHSLWDQRENDIVYLTNKILNDVGYEFDLISSAIDRPNILNMEKSFDLILNSRKSFVRTGDGEIKIMMGIDQPFQKYDKDLAIGLKNIFLKKNDNLLIGINRNYYLPGYLSDYSVFYRRYAYDYRQFYKTLLNKNYTYIDATLTSFEFGQHDNTETINRYKKWRELFRNKELLIVCGEGILDKLDYDVFELAKEKIFLFGPSKHAWERHNELIESIKKAANKNTIIVFILGMAGKVMVSELSKMGFTCWDVGHLAKYYDAYKKGIAKTEKNIRNFYAPD